MLVITEHHRIYVACQSFDFRMGIDGFAAICRKHFNLNPCCDYCFIFRSKDHTAIKILLYDGRGFWLCHKRLSKGKFKQWPNSSKNILTMNTQKLHLLLQQ